MNTFPNIAKINEFHAGIFPCLVSAQYYELNNVGKLHESACVPRPNYIGQQTVGREPVPVEITPAAARNGVKQQIPLAHCFSTNSTSGP